MRIRNFGTYTALLGKRNCEPGEWALALFVCAVDAVLASHDLQLLLVLNSLCCGVVPLISPDVGGPVRVSCMGDVCSVSVSVGVKEEGGL